MKKIILLIGMDVLLLLLACIAIPSFFCRTLLIGVFVILFLILSLNFFRMDKKWHKAPDLLTDPRRNFDYLHIGVSGGEVKGYSLDLTVVDSNIKSDFAMIQRWFGLLKKGGTVCLHIKATDKYFDDRKISVFVLQMLHPVTLKREKYGGILYSYVYRWREFLTPGLYCIKYINKILFKNRKRNLKDRYLEEIERIKVFLDQRKIKLCVYIDNEPIQRM